MIVHVPYIVYRLYSYLHAYAQSQNDTYILLLLFLFNIIETFNSSMFIVLLIKKQTVQLTVLCTLLLIVL